ncbi:DUF4411 family protein [Bacteroides sp.]|uniref:DUF4411 family protein n=1 Tax=Bacteroides sp. TaxID=29523 RepID=UPI0025BD4709|nr:DUF4411 family protein [Bacteroides sp.]
MAYIFDTNIFIRSKHEMPMDLWLTFWTKIAGMINSGNVFSNIQVKGEIDKGGDELTDWMKVNVSAGFYIENELDVMVKYGEVMNWAQSNAVYRLEAVSEFATVADAYLVATAAAKGYTLVTNETADPQCRRRVKIPDVCNALGVRFCDLNTVLRELNITI